MLRRYSELITLPTFEERIKYLQLQSGVGIDTFGFDRYLNQAFYNSSEWKRIRRSVIIRDNGCDLAFPGQEIRYGILIHHLNPITKEDVMERNPVIFDPENLVVTCQRTHNLIHYGPVGSQANAVVERKPGDTCPWRKSDNNV